MPWRSTGRWDVLKGTSRSCGHEPDNTHLAPSRGSDSCCCGTVSRPPLVRTRGGDFGLSRLRLLFECWSPTPTRKNSEGSPRNLKRCGLLCSPMAKVDLRDCMKSPQTRASRLAMRRIMAAYTNASPLAHDLS